MEEDVPSQEIVSCISRVHFILFLTTPCPSYYSSLSASCSAFSAFVMIFSFPLRVLKTLCLPAANSLKVFFCHLRGHFCDPLLPVDVADMWHLFRTSIFCISVAPLAAVIKIPDVSKRVGEYFRIAAIRSSMCSVVQGLNSAPDAPLMHASPYAAALCPE